MGNIAYKIDRFCGERGNTDYAVIGHGDKNIIMIPGMSFTPVTPSAPAVASAYSIFADDYTIWLIDRRDFVLDGITIDDMADDVAELMMAKNIDNGYIFGVSQGGMIAEVLAEKYPNLCRALLLGSTMSRQNESTIDTFTKWMKLADAGEISALNRCFYERVYTPEYIEQNRAAFERLYDSDIPNLARFRALTRSCLEFDRHDELRRITCPTLVIGAAKDVIMTPKASLDIAAALGCDVYIYDDYGHSVYDEAPDYKQKMKDFFDGVR